MLKISFHEFDLNYIPGIKVAHFQTSLYCCKCIISLYNVALYQKCVRDVELYFLMYSKMFRLDIK